MKFITIMQQFLFLIPIFKTIRFFKINSLLSFFNKPNWHFRLFCFTCLLGISILGSTLTSSNIKGFEEVRSKKIIIKNLIKIVYLMSPCFSIFHSIQYTDGVILLNVDYKADVLSTQQTSYIHLFYTELFISKFYHYHRL